MLENHFQRNNGGLLIVHSPNVMKPKGQHPSLMNYLVLLISLTQKIIIVRLTLYIRLEEGN